MVRAQAFPFDSWARATSGQFTWVYLNQLIDVDERKRKIHIQCLAKWESDTCEVCGELVYDTTNLPPEIQDEIYRPGDDPNFVPQEVEVDLTEE